MHINISRAAVKLLNFMYFFVGAAAILMLCSCIKNTELVGYTFKSENIDKIKVGQTSKSYIKNTLGSPSLAATYGGDIWYYVATEYETVAFFKPKVKNQKVVEISFGSNDIVSNLKEYSASDAQNVKIISDTTNAQGNDVGVIGQLLGNVGRFNSEPGKPKISKPRNVPY